MTATPPRVIAKGGPRACATCRAKRELVVRAVRTEAKKSGIRFAGYCATCGNHVGAVATSKVDEGDQVALELHLDEVDPPQLGMFGKGSSAPQQVRGDGA